MKKFVSGMIIALLFLGIPLSLIHSGVAGEERVIKIIDANTGSSSITLGNETEPLPPGGYPFTVNVILEGLTENLFCYQIAVSFNNTKVRCTAAWIPTNNPSFVFYGSDIVQGVQNITEANLYGCIGLGAALQDILHPVTVSQGIFCQINFTAIKTGTASLDIVPTNATGYIFDTFLWDDRMFYMEFTSTSFSFTATASQSPPIASFEFSPSNPRANQTVTFDASESCDPDGEIVSYVWDFGDGSTNETTNTTITHVFSSNGIFSVNLTVFDNDAFLNSMAKEIPVGSIPVVNFTFEPTEIRVGMLVTLNASGSYDLDGQIASYVWDFDDGNITTTTEAIVTHVFVQNGVYSVNLTVFNDDGLYNSTSQPVLVGFRPIPNLYFRENPLPDEEVVFDASLSYDPDGHIVYAIWDFGDFNVTAVNVTNPTHLVITHAYVHVGGMYPLNLTVFDNDGLYASIVRIVNVAAIPQPTTIFTFNVVWNYTDHRVIISSNSTVTLFNFKPSMIEINFNLSGGTGTTGYCNVTIPNTLLRENPWTVKINGQDWSFIPSENATHSFIYFTYTHASTLKVTIQGTWVIPEFSSPGIMPLLILLSTVAVVVAKKRRPRKLRG